MSLVVECQLLAESVSTDCLRGTTGYAAFLKYTGTRGTTDYRPKPSV